MWFLAANCAREKSMKSTTTYTEAFHFALILDQLCDSSEQGSEHWDETGSVIPPPNVFLRNLRAVFDFLRFPSTLTLAADRAGWYRIPSISAASLALRWQTHKYLGCPPHFPTPMAIASPLSLLVSSLEHHLYSPPCSLWAFIFPRSVL